VATDCNERIRAFAELIGRTLGPEIALDLRLAEDSGPVVVDPALFDAALMNLALNARDAQDGRGRIILQTQTAEFEPDDVRPPELAPGAYLVVSVTDFGSGMPPEVQRRAFEPLFTTKKDGRGTGFGLPMVYGFAKQAGGVATLYSEPGRGTTVRIYLPLPEESARAESAEQPLPAEPEPAGGGSVLIVDDNEAARRVLARQLERRGFEVTEASDAAAALAVFGDGTGFDLLISDVVMPGAMGGSDLADRLVGLKPSLKVLLISGYPADALEDSPDARACYELIAKPYRQRVMLARIARLLGRLPPDGPTQ